MNGEVVPDDWSRPMRVLDIPYELPECNVRSSL